MALSDWQIDMLEAIAETGLPNHRIPRGMDDEIQVV